VTILTKQQTSVISGPPFVVNLWHKSHELSEALFMENTLIDGKMQSQ